MKKSHLRGEEVAKLRALVPSNMLVVNVDLTKPPHHRQLEILIVNSLVGSTGKRETVGDFQPCVSNETKQSPLSNSGSGG